MFTFGIITRRRWFIGSLVTLELYFYDLIILKINETAFSPKDRILASASSDKSVIIGEIPDVSL